MSRKGLDNRQILTLMELKGCSSATTIALSEYAMKNHFVPDSLSDLGDFLKKCHASKIIKRGFAMDPATLEEAEERAERIIANADRHGIGILTCADSRYPDMLSSLVDENGKNTVPAVLYYRGDLSAAGKPGIAIIGTREPTPEGVKVGHILGGMFAKAGFNIVSGLALGCDTSGHKGALDAGGVTTAFLGHGLDTIYPEENRELAEEIVASGGILFSEYPVGTPVSRYNLVARDRLQAGLSRATIVIQTDEKGGTMHAANATLASKKPLYVVRYCSQDLMQNEQVRGNVLLASKGAEYISLENVTSVIESLGVYISNEVIIN